MLRMNRTASRHGIYSGARGCHIRQRCIGTRAMESEGRLFLTERAEALMQRGWLVEDEFDSCLLPKLRQQFVDRFKDPLDVNADRFIWDYWHVPDQYSLMRTTAEAFFDEVTYKELEEAILSWAGKVGCRSCSPMWLSYYVDSHAQELHTDAPHGPFAFVLSLTDFENRKFTGGETQLLKQETILSGFWAGASSAKEVHDLFDFIEPQFGRLTVFDGRIPHGVRQVRGVREPTQGRVVIHGWLTEPSPYFEGDIDQDRATTILNGVLAHVFDEIRQLPRCTGIVVPRLTVNQHGDVESIDILSCTLQCVDAGMDRFEAVDGVLEAIEVAFGVGGLFEDTVEPGSNAFVVLPFVFD